jgi:hypothetical protein
MATKKKNINENEHSEDQELTVDEVDTSVKESAAQIVVEFDKLSEETKGHLSFCLSSLSDIARRSNNPDFRKKVKHAVSELSKLL